MAQIKVNELTGVALDWVVAKCEGYEFLDDTYMLVMQEEEGQLCYSSTWAEGGTIIEREGFCLIKTDAVWQCTTNGNELHSHAKQGPSPLIAAMRCYVASKLGDVVEVPDALIK